MTKENVFFQFMPFVLAAVLGAFVIGCFFIRVYIENPIHAVIGIALIILSIIISFIIAKIVPYEEIKTIPCPPRIPQATSILSDKLHDQKEV